MCQDINLFKNLVRVESGNLLGSEYLLSVYLPTERLNIADVKKRIKSIFLKKDVLRDSVFKKVESQIDIIKNCKNGLAIFAKIENQNGLVKMSDENFWMETMLSTPEQSLSLSKIFNLDQLIWADQDLMCSVILSLNQDEAKIYGLKNNEINLIKRIENPMIEDRGKETSVSSTGTFYNLGETKINQEKIETARGLLSEVIRIIKLDEREFKDEYEYFTIAYSSHFTDLIDNFSKTIRQIFSHSKGMILINKNIKIDDELKDITARKIKLKTRMEKRQALNTAKNLYMNYIEGWENVIEAANLYKIKKLFIKKGVKIKGYILNKNELHINPTQEAKLTNNLVPWLFKNVLTSDGEIVIFNKNDRVNFSEVAAQVRY